MSKPRALVVGCGFMGSAVAKSLADRGFDVHATTTGKGDAPPDAGPGVTLHQLELEETGRLHELLGPCRVAVLAAGPRRGGSYRAVFLEGARSFVRALATTDVTRVLFASSTRVYGEKGGAWVTEDEATGPADEKTEILRAMERTMLDGAAALGVRAAGLRLGGLHGPGRSLDDRISRHAGGELSGGSRYVNLVHIDDVARAVLFLLDHDHHGAINVTDGQPEQRAVMYQRVLTRLGLPTVRWTDDDQPPKGKRVSNALLSETFGFAFNHVDH